MSEIAVTGLDGIVSNCFVYDLDESVKASKYPMATNTDSVDSEITARVCTLGKAVSGSGHDNFLKGVRVCFDFNVSNKIWVEAERYHFFDIVSSQSTMHKITKFDLSSGFVPEVDSRVIDILQEKIDYYNHLKDMDLFTPNHKSRLDEAFLDIVYNVPSGIKLTARITTNYQQLKTIYNQRHNHRLPEWREFCEWILKLPHWSELVEV